VVIFVFSLRLSSPKQKTRASFDGGRESLELKSVLYPHAGGELRQQQQAAGLGQVHIRNYNTRED